MRYFRLSEMTKDDQTDWIKRWCHNCAKQHTCTIRARSAIHSLLTIHEHAYDEEEIPCCKAYKRTLAQFIPPEDDQQTIPL